MINPTIHNIVKQYSSKYSDGFLRFDLNAMPDYEILTILKQNLNLKEEYLEFINCCGCDKELQIRKKEDENKTRFINCFGGGCGTYKEFKNNEDLAYKINLDGIADFLINLLEITGSKQNIITNKLINLGKKEMFGLDFNIYLLKEALNPQEIINHCKPKSKQTPSIIIKLTNKNLRIDQANINDCWFSDLIFYDDNLNKFSINYKIFTDTISGCFEGLQKTTIKKLLDQNCLEWFKELIKNNIIKRGEKEKFRIIANNIFSVSPNKYDEIWKKHATKGLKRGGL